MEGQDRLQSLGETPRKRLPLGRERVGRGGVGGGEDVWRRVGRHGQKRRSVGIIGGGGDANRHATAPTAVGGRL